MVENRTYLLQSHTGEQVHKFRDFYSVFKVLKQSGDWDTSATKHPSSAHSLGITFDH